MKLLTIGTLALSLGMAFPSFAQTASMSPAKAAVLKDHSLRASKLLHAPVYNATGEEIGTIDDVLVDLKGGEPRAVLSVGKYVGTGEAMVAVPLSTVELGTGKMLMPKGTKEHVMAMPKFKYDYGLEGGGG